MDEGAMIQRLRGNYGRLKNDRMSWDQYWRDVKKYMCPGRGRFLAGENPTEVNNGQKDDPLCRINCEASRALEVLASGIQSGLTSKARQWFLLTCDDVQLAKEHAVRVWYGEVQEILEHIFQRSNVYSALRNAYYEMAAFGQAVVSVSYHPEKVITCRCHTAGTYCLEMNHRQEIDTVYYCEWLTAPQMADEYGEENLPDYIKDRLGPNGQQGQGGMTERYEVITMVTKSPSRYGLEWSDELPVTSVHFLNRAGSSGDGISEKFLRVSGYRDFPFMCPRWDVVDNDVYGWAPSRDIMGDTKQLQKMEEQKLKGLAKIVSPPMRIPPEMERRGLNMRPGALNVVNSMQENAVAPLYTVGIDIQQLTQAAEALKQNIKDGLYNSLFLSLLMQDNPQMTATEVQARQAEKMLMLGPVLERIHCELLDPLISRTFGLAVQEGLIPEPPDDLDNMTNIEYVSILSQAQKAVGVSRIEQSLTFLGSLIQTAPEVRHLVDWYKMYREYNQMIGVREDIFVSKEEYDEKVQQERQMQAAQAMGQAVQPMAESAEALSKVNPANLKELLGGQMGGAMM